MGEEVLTVPMVADELITSHSAVYALIRSGRLRAFRIGKAGIRVTRGALEAFKAGETQQVGAA